MIELVKSDIIKIKILKQLLDGKEVSFNYLRELLGNINFNSVERNCEFLKLLNFITIEEKIVKNKSRFYISITQKGKDFVENLNILIK